MIIPKFSHATIAEILQMVEELEILLSVNPAKEDYPEGASKFLIVKEAAKYFGIKSSQITQFHIQLFGSFLAVSLGSLLKSQIDK